MFVKKKRANTKQIEVKSTPVSTEVSITIPNGLKDLPVEKILSMRIFDKSVNALVNNDEFWKWILNRDYPGTLMKEGKSHKDLYKELHK